MGTSWVRYPALYQPSVAKRAESGQIDTIVPMVTVQMGVEGTVLRCCGHGSLNAPSYLIHPLKSGAWGSQNILVAQVFFF